MRSTSVTKYGILHIFHQKATDFISKVRMMLMFPKFIRCCTSSINSWAINNNISSWMKITTISLTSNQSLLVLLAIDNHRCWGCCGAFGCSKSPGSFIVPISVMFPIFYFLGNNDA